MTNYVAQQNQLDLKNLSKNNSIFYIFEINIKYINNENIKVRRIKNLNYGNLINENDFIINDINKIKFTIFDINDPLNTIVIKKKINGNINGLILKNNRILIQLIGSSKYIESNYKFIN